MSKKQLFLLRFFIVLLFVILIISAITGSFSISFNDFINNKLKPLHNSVLYEIRFPRVLLAGLVGASLSVSGACLQGLFRNPLADPGLIGVSSGAALGVASTIVLTSGFFASFSQYVLPISGFIGSFLIIIILFYITKGFGYSGMTYLLLAGIAINAFAGVGIGFLTYLSNDQELRSLTFWTMGSFGGASWNLLIPALFFIFPSLIWVIRLSKKLDVIQLGEIEAQRLGINIKKLRFSIIISSAIIVGVSVSLSGMIGFVGLIVPHMIRMIGGVQHSFVLKSSIVFGACLMILADLLSRTMIMPAELPVGLITSAIGSPFFLWLIFIIRKKQLR